MAEQGKIEAPKRLWGKIAKLPIELMDGVNEMLRDGTKPQQISEWLIGLGHNVSVDCVQRWNRSGHKTWLLELKRLEEMDVRRECVLKIAEDNSKESIHEASLRLAASQLYDVFSHFDIKSLKRMLKQKPEHYAPLLGVLTRLSKGCLDIEKFKVNVAEQKRKIEAQLGAAKKGGGLTAEGIGAIREALNLM